MKSSSLSKLLVAVLAVSFALLFTAACASTNATTAGEAPAKMKEISGRAPITGGLQRDGIEVVQDDFVVVAILDLGPGEVALVDAGNAQDAGPILSALARRGLGPEAVKAILLTHGDGDHIRGVPRFPNAEVMALEADLALVEGRAVKVPSRPAKPTGIAVTRALRDGEIVELGSVRIEVFAVPGHTPGSAAFLTNGVLFLGDSAGASVDGELLPGDPKHTVDQPLNRASLRNLAARLAPRASEIDLLVPSHTSALDRGLTPLLDLAARPEE
ncbi:MAG: MBL fold metallo-hydrolase [Myxococcales bacterium]|jgi:glyoxylase-like metal-dependent hydrolase (beta-lactamase superfamily II)|nr:MBL fold metallo-hydrolase [Myxococcales bacterium]